MHGSAVIDSSTTKILEELSREFPFLRFQAHFSSTYSESNDISQMMNVYCAINLNTCGFSSIMDDVGKALRLMKAYLQQLQTLGPGNI